jgi:lipoprotein-releasing system ATP-binding protein
MLVQLQSIYKSFGQVHAVSNVSLSLEEKKQYIIQGPSGSGKSTLLYLLAGLDRPTSGEIIVNERDLSMFNDEQLASYRNEFIGLVFQFHFLLSTLNCMNNILLPAKIGGKNTPELKNEVIELAKELSIIHCLEKFPYELSGGEQQRVNIIRALSMHPKLILCDEPTGNLDSNNSQNVVSLLKDLSTDYNSTLVVVTHNDKVADKFDNHFFIEDGILQK